MMKLYRIVFITPLICMLACTDLDLEPSDLATAESVFADPTQYEAFLAKLYAGLTVTGQQ